MNCILSQLSITSALIIKTLLDLNLIAFLYFLRKPAKIEWRYTEEGEKVRVSLRTGRIIPIPPSHEETIDYKSPAAYVDGEKDTDKQTVEEVTFKVSSNFTSLIGFYSNIND